MRTPARVPAIMLMLVVTSCTAAQILEVEPAQDSMDPVGPYRISASVSEPQRVRDLSVLWRAWTPVGDGGVVPGDPQRARMSQETEGFFEGAIPGQPLGSRVEYTVQLTDVTGVKSRDPAGDDTYVFHIGAFDAGVR